MELLRLFVQNVENRWREWQGRRNEVYVSWRAVVDAEKAARV